MMKKQSTTILLIMAIATGLLWLNNCKKEQPTRQTEVSTVDENNEAILSRILDFKNRMENYQANSGLKGGTLYTPPDAVEEVEALINFNFCYTDISCNKKTFGKTEVTMPLDELGKIGESRLAQLYYEEIIDSIQAQMLSVNYPDMKLLLVDLEQTGTDGNGDAIISIGVLVGNEGNINISGDEEGWWFGLEGGTCEHQYSGVYDATIILEGEIMAANFPAPPPGKKWRKKTIFSLLPIVPEDHFLVPENQRNNYKDSKLFYADIEYGTITDDTRCLSGYDDPASEMLFYQAHYNHFIYKADSIYESFDFTECIIDDYELYQNYVQSRIWHELTIYLGDVWLVNEDDVQIEDILEY